MKAGLFILTFNRAKSIFFISNLILLSYHLLFQVIDNALRTKFKKKSKAHKVNDGEVDKAASCNNVTGLKTCG